ncbi:HlyD family secretion protein [Pelagibius sp.]|uniref:HlyD family secretion protein n=1 Tax=Pelagibius sp. TaxID=1931238 RepID=UPI003BB11A7B
MRILREKPSQRRHHRVAAPLLVTFAEGQRYRCADWSLGGFLISGFDGELPAEGTVTTMNLELPFQGFEISFEVEGRVVRVVSEDRSIAYEFVDLSERARDLMSHFIEDLIRGKMASVDDAICRIDVPVTPISTQPDVNPKGETSMVRWPVKTVLMSAFYLVLGACVFGYLGILLYSNIMRLEVQSAVISAPLQTLKMPVDGILRPVRFTAGARVRKGEEIARIENLALGARVSEANIDYIEAREALWRAEQKYRIEEERLKLYRIVNRTDRDIVVARIEARKEALKAADANLARMRSLAKKGHVTAAKLDEAVNRQAKAAAGLRETELELERTTAMDAVSARRHYNHKEFVTDLDMLAVDISAARSRFETAAMRLTALEARQARQVIRAPFDGRIVSLFQAADTSIVKNAPLLLLEQDSDLTVTAFLDQDEVLMVGLNDHAKVFLPALNRHIPAQVVAIDRNSAFVDPENGHYIWRDRQDRTAAVSLRLELDEADGMEVSAGLPAVVIFRRRLTNDIYAGLTAPPPLPAGDRDAEPI